MKKRVLGLLLTAMLVLSACGGQKAPTQTSETAPAESTETSAPAETQTAAPAGEAPAAAGVDVNAFTTIGDILNAGVEELQTSTYDTWFIYVFKSGDTIYRAICTAPEETVNAIFDLEFDDAEYDSKMAELISPLTIDRIENLTLAIPPQEELDGYVGLIGQDLLDSGWTSQGYNLESMEFYMNHGAYLFAVTMEGEVEESDDTDAMIAPLTVTAIRYYDLGDATNLESDNGM